MGYIDTRDCSLALRVCGIDYTCLGHHAYEELLTCVASLWDRLHVSRTPCVSLPSLVVPGVVVYHDEEPLLFVVLLHRGEDPQSLVLHLRGNLITRGMYKGSGGGHFDSKRGAGLVVSDLERTLMFSGPYHGSLRSAAARFAGRRRQRDRRDPESQ